MSVLAAMSGAGAAVGLIAGGLLTSYLSRRWVLFVNVPIGVATAAAAPFALAGSARRRVRLDLLPHGAGPALPVRAPGRAALSCRCRHRRFHPAGHLRVTPWPWGAS